MTTQSVVTNDVAKAIADRVSAKKSELENSIAAYERYITEKRKAIENLEEQTTNFFGVKAQLEANGFEVKVCTWTDRLTVNIDKKQLTDVYKVIGRLNGESANKEIVDSRKRLIRVSLRAVKHPFVNVTYQTKLAKGAKCKIETVKYKARTEKVLTCER